MNKFLIILPLFLFPFLLIAQIVSIPDTIFFNGLKQNGVDQNNDGKIQVSEAAATKHLQLLFGSIYDFSGLEAFTSLKSLELYTGGVENFDLSIPTLTYLHLGRGFNKADLSGLPMLDTIVWHGANWMHQIDLTKNKKLKSVNLLDNGSNSGMTTEVNVSGLIELEYLACGGLAMSHLDVTTNPTLRNLILGSMQVENTDLSRNPLLEFVEFYSMPLADIDISKNPALKVLRLENIPADRIDVSNNKMLSELYISKGAITSLDLSHNDSLKVLDISMNNIPSIDISKNQKLEKLICNKCILTNIDIYANLELKVLEVNYNNLSALNITHNTKLTSLDISFNNIRTLDLHNLPLLSQLNTSSNPLGLLDVRENVELLQLRCQNNNLKSLDMSNQNKLVSLACDTNEFSFLNLYPTLVVKFSARNNFLLTEVCVNDAQYKLSLNRNNINSFPPKHNLSTWFDDGNITYNTNCSAITTGIEPYNYDMDMTSKTILKKFNIQGQELTGSAKGLGVVIIKYSDGSTKKVIE
ncbi:MAG: hypothetical protein H7329_18845 [Opitutaceae bacterium]|nr:hypothetical protein [Cytophagales bacterium]